MAAMSSPPPPDWSLWAFIADHLMAPLIALAGSIVAALGALVRLLWRSSAKMTSLEEKQAQQDREIAEIKARRDADVLDAQQRHAIQDAKFANLATTEALENVQTAIVGELRASLANMTTLISRQMK